MKRRHVAAAIVGALVAAMLAAAVAYLLGSPEWTPWLTLVTAFVVFALGFLIVAEAVTEEQPAQPVAVKPTAGLDLMRPVERRTFNPQPHFVAAPREVFASLVGADDTGENAPLRAVYGHRAGRR